MSLSRRSRLGTVFFLVWPLVPIAASFVGVTRWGVRLGHGDAARGPSESGAPSAATTVSRTADAR